jgi:hypothetical protein
VGELSWWRPQTSYQAVYVGNGSGWSLSTIPFSTETGWRGDAPNNNQADRGWTITFHIPFSSLGLTGPPPTGNVWSLAFLVHDKDSAASPAVSNSFWPEDLVRDQLTTWGQLGFGLRTYPTITPTSATQTYTVRHGLNGVVTNDAMVGGGSTCGTGDYFNIWGAHNYAGSTTLVVQNQADVADWPCFSKIYLEFPLDMLPAGKVLVSATLTVYQFGGSDPSQAQRSLIQVLTVNAPWAEGSITWNNAPLAVENMSQSWVDPMQGPLVWPGTARTWSVSLPVAQAYTTQQGVVRLALYSADSAYHSGKYFSSREVGDWNAIGRPTLQVVLADSATSPGPPQAPTGLRIIP